MMQNVTQHYLQGIKEGREILKKHGTELITIQERIDNLKSTLRGFDKHSPVGQMLLGELDFWKKPSEENKTRVNCKGNSMGPKFFMLESTHQPQTKGYKMSILVPLFASLAIVALMVVAARPAYYIKKACKVMGFGFLVYHSDSKKYFYSLTKKDALEWMGATYADAVIFSNWTKETLAVKLAKA